MGKKLFWGNAGILSLTFFLFLANAQTAPLVPQRGGDMRDELMALI